MHRYTRLSILLVVVALLAGCGTASAQNATSHPLPRALLFIGDSLTGGYYATDQTHDYVAHVTADLGLPALYLSKHYGIRADEVQAEIQHGLAIPPARITVVELGTNDFSGYSLVGAHTPEGLAAFTTAYRALLGEIRHVAPSTRLVCIGIWHVPGDTNDLHETAGSYDQHIASACQAAHGTYVSLEAIAANGAYRGPVGQHTWLGLNDGWHPNDAGHTAIAAAIVHVLGH